MFSQASWNATLAVMEGHGGFSQVFVHCSSLMKQATPRAGYQSSP